eukprot:3787259-Pleurochrysis_carterae.AAC.2
MLVSTCSTLLVLVLPVGTELSIDELLNGRQGGGTEGGGTALTVSMNEMVRFIVLKPDLYDLLWACMVLLNSNLQFRSPETRCCFYPNSMKEYTEDSLTVLLQWTVRHKLRALRSGDLFESKRQQVP